MFLVEFLHWLLSYYLSFAPPLGAVALLSLSVFLIMLPLYALGDRIALGLKRRKEPMQAELDSIQNLPGSTKRYYYTQEMYRRYGYNPLQSLSGLFGLALQLPFFLAAYHMLHNYRAFDGTPAGLFADLAAPDQLLLLWGEIPLNLLPLLMTLLNLLSAYYYSAGEPKREILPQLFLPLAFLFLLYQQPVALVFYWTLNNLFSLLKNLWIAKINGHSLALRWPQLATLRGQKSQVAFFPALVLACFLSIIYLGYGERSRAIPSLLFWAALLTWAVLFILLPRKSAQQEARQ